MRWRKIKNSLYEINDKGGIRNGITHRIRKTKINHCGYETICIKVNGKMSTCRIHRLVAIAFIPNPLNKPEVHHLDGNKLNNTIENLQWSEPDDNKNFSRYILGHSKMYSFKKIEAMYNENKDISLKQFITKLKKD